MIVFRRIRGHETVSDKWNSAVSWNGPFIGLKRPRGIGGAYCDYVQLHLTPVGISQVLKNERQEVTL